VANSQGCGIVSDGWTGPIGRIVFGTGRSGRFKNLILKSKIKGIVYSGNNDPNATVIFNPRSVIPIAVTNEKHLNGNDFLNWNYRITEDLTSKIDKFKDFYSIGETLKNKGIIQSYLKQPPRFNLLRVVLNNGKTSFYDIENDFLISKAGFDSIFVPEEDDGTVIIPFILKTPKGELSLFICKNGGEYYICKKTGPSNYQAVMTIGQYDKKFSTLNESYDDHNNHHGPSIPRNAIGEFKRITGINGHVEPVFHRTDNIKSCESICKTGFSPQYSTTEAYGHGIYTSTSLNGCNAVLKGYGGYMILGFLKEGYKNFIIFDEKLAKKYYGDKYRIADQFKSLIRPHHYDEMVRKYDYIFKLPSFSEEVKVLNNNLLLKLEREHDIGKTNIRGVVVQYWNSGMLAPVICDWKAVIPYGYSTDDGNHWNVLLNRESHDSINKHKDALFAIQKLIADGVVKDTFKYRWSDIKSHPQYINGYLRVELTNGNFSFYSSEDEDLISYIGFPNAIGWNEDKKGRLKLDCTCFGENNVEIPVRIYKINGDYWICIQNEKGQYAPRLTLEDYDGN
jgi:hypothetical protein